jgi:hypothetical protein
MDVQTGSETAADLAAVRRRRAELRETLQRLEEALAAPAAGRAVVWGERVQQALARLAQDFALHIEVTEGPDGLHQSILSGDLRLANAVDALTAEHASITAEISAVSAATEAPVTPTDVPLVREDATRLMGHVIKHRQRGADLVYEAYATDIGGNG